MILFQLEDIKQGLKMFKSILILFLVFSFSCTKKDTAESALVAFVEYGFSSDLTKQGILDLTGGGLNKHIEELSDEDFSNFKKSNTLTKKRLKINLQTCELNSCTITYTLSYRDDKEKDSKNSVEVKRIAVLENAENGWKVTDINSVKSFIKVGKPVDISQDGETKVPAN